MKKRNKRSRFRRYAEYDLSRYAFEDIFGSGSVDIKKIKEFKSEVEGFRKIDQAVFYIKAKGRDFRIKYLNIVKSIKFEHEKEFESLVSSGSPYAYMAVLISIVTLADALSGKVGDIITNSKGNILGPMGEVYDVARTLKRQNLRISGSLGVLAIVLILLVITVALYFYLNLKNTRSEKEILKYLIYLEKQLESDI